MKRLIALAGFLLASSTALAECEKFTVPYAGTAIMQFCLWEPDGTGFKVDASCEASTDNLIIKDQAAQTASENCFVDEGSCYSITVDATDTTVKTGTIMLVDDDNLWLDKCLTYVTYGHANAFYPISEVSLSTQGKADVNAELLDVLTTDTFGELTTCPAATSSIRHKLEYLYMRSRNKFDEGSGVQTVYRDDGSTGLCEMTSSDNGTTYTRGEAAVP